jgi:tetratricopeptide (TPR) repeat protein
VVKFVGRAEKLEQLHAQLQQNERIAITAIAGMGGIGKTELALQYAIDQKNQGYYPAGLCWLRARDREIATELLTFAQTHLGLSIPEQLEIDAQVRFCWRMWPQGEALIVLDDVTDYQAIEPYLPPADPRFKLLITTRLDLGSTFQKVPLEELDEAGSIALLESLVGEERVRSQLADAQGLCKWVGYLPLALELLGRFLVRKLDWSIDQLLKALEEKRLYAKALVETENGMTGQLGVAAALELSWQELNEAEQELACVLGMFAIAPIPWLLLESCQPEVEPDDLEEIRDDGLMARSLLKRVGDGSYQLHQIVQEYFRIKLGERGDRGQSMKATFWQVMVGIARSIGNTPTIDQIEQVRKSVSHMEEGVRSWIDSIPDENLTSPFAGIGHFYEGQGNHSFAEPWRVDCLEVTRQRLGEENAFVAESLHNLASIYHSQGKYKEAEPLFKSALEMFTRLVGKEDIAIAKILNNLALLYRSQGRYREAEPLYKSSLEMLKRILGLEDPDVATSLNNLASLYRLQGKYTEAEPLFKSVLDIFNRLGEKKKFAVTESNLALLYELQGRYAEAETLYKSALKSFKYLLGEEHPDVAQGMNNLASLYRLQGKYKKAEKLHISALQSRRHFLGEEHPDVAQSMNNLATLYLSQKKYEKAKPLYISALECRKRCLGEEHPDVATSLSDLATLSMQQGEYEEARLLYCSALEIEIHLLGEDHPFVAMSLHHLGILCQKQGRYTEAERLCHQALTIAQSKLGQAHPWTQVILSCLNSLP